MGVTYTSSSNHSWISSPMTKTSRSSLRSRILEKLYAGEKTRSLYQNYQRVFGDFVCTRHTDEEKSGDTAPGTALYFLKDGLFYYWMPWLDSGPNTCKVVNNPGHQYWIEMMLEWQAEYEP